MPRLSTTQWGVALLPATLAASVMVAVAAGFGGPAVRDLRRPGAPSLRSVPASLSASFHHQRLPHRQRLRAGDQPRLPRVRGPRRGLPAALRGHRARCCCGATASPRIRPGIDRRRARCRSGDRRRRECDGDAGGGRHRHRWRRPLSRPHRQHLRRAWPPPSRRDQPDLTDAIDAVLAGRFVTQPATEAFGCFITPPPVPSRYRDEHPSSP